MNSIDFKIREAALTDAEKLFNFFNKLDVETHFMLFESGERNTSIEEQEKHIKEITSSDSKAMFVVESNGNIVGFVVAIGGFANRNRHSALIVIGILQAYWHMGIGSQLLITVEAWAKGKHMHRLELTVMTHNQRAINLYDKSGFEREGLKRNSLLVDGKYVDELYMAKLI
jgi:RimJ/RimL family protein N-acetyltransferase